MGAADFQTLALFTMAVVFGLLAGFAGVIGHGLASGRVVTRGLLADKTSERISPARVQLLALTLAGAGYYLLLVFRSLETGPALPEIPEELLALLLGSNTFYLTAKAGAVAKFVQTAAR